jgi:hypothetical protein
VERGIEALDTQNGPGPDGIDSLILKNIVLVVKKPLAVLFNLSLLSGVFPCVWKESYVVPLKRQIFRTIVEYLFYRRFLSFLKS